MIGSSFEVDMISGSPPVRSTLLISGCSRIYAIPAETSRTTSSLSSMNSRLRKQNLQYAPQTSLHSSKAVSEYLCSRPGTFV